MLRNREIKYALYTMIVLSTILCLLVWKYPGDSLLFCIIGCILFFVIFYSFTRYRYHNIHNLSSYLHQIQAGEYTLDLRDNAEGELSYLKNEIYKVTLKLTEQTELLKRDKTYLADAISDISHQLKTPLTSMMMMADLLNDNNLPAVKREEFTSNLHKQLERIEWLVSALLKMSKLDAGTVILKQEKVMVKDIINSATAHLLIPLEIREQELIVEGAETTSFLGDYAWTTEALANIIKNCMEHTPAKGTIQISFYENSIFTAIQVMDNGEGITKEDLAHIFERFYKGKNATSESVGIGLAMAKQIIQQQGGKIEVESTPGVGSRFILKIYKRVI